MDEDAFEAQLRASLLGYFQRLADRLNGLAELQFVEEDPETHGFDSDYEGNVGHWSFRPANPDAAEVQWHITESDGYSTYLALGRYTACDRVGGHARCPARALRCSSPVLVAAGV